MRRERLLNLGLKLCLVLQPPFTGLYFEEQLREKFPERYKSYDKWKRQSREYEKLLDAFLAKEKVDIP